LLPPQGQSCHSAGWRLVSDIKKPKDQQADAERDLVLFGKLGLPVTERFLYQRHNVPQPKPRDELFVPSASNIKVEELVS
jgi:hypothetical protein